MSTPDTLLQSCAVLFRITFKSPCTCGVSYKTEQDKTNVLTFCAMVIPHCGRISTLAVQHSVSSDSASAASGCLCRGLAVAAPEARRHEVRHAAGLEERRALGREEVLDEPRGREDACTRVETPGKASQNALATSSIYEYHAFSCCSLVTRTSDVRCVRVLY